MARDRILRFRVFIFTLLFGARERYAAAWNCFSYR